MLAREGGTPVPQQAVLYLSLALAGLGFGAECPSPPALRPTPPPWELEANSSIEIWKKLSIPSGIRSEKASQTDSVSLDCSKGCHVTVVSNDVLVDEDGQDSVLRVCTPDDAACRFVLLHEGVAGWSLVDYIDSPYEKYAPPEVSVVPASTRRWLVRRGYGGGGSGVALKNEDWFEVQCGRLVKVLSHPSWGYDADANPARHFRTRFVGFESRDQTESLVFAYVVRFDNDEDNKRLWQQEQRVVFSRKVGDTAFVFDSGASTLEHRWQAMVFSFDSLEGIDFLEFAYDRLLAIARDKSDRRWTWLQRFAAKLPATPRSQALRSVLTGN